MNRKQAMEEFLRYTQTVDGIVSRWDSMDAVRYWSLIQKYASGRQDVEIVFSNLLDREYWPEDNDLVPPGIMFLCGLWLVRWALFKTASDENFESYMEDLPEWVAALRWTGEWLEGGKTDPTGSSD